MWFFSKKTQPRGIVVTAGGPLYFLNAYLNCRLLRDKGCELPIEWFYLGAEMTPAMLHRVRKIPHLRLVNLGGKSTNNAKDKGGWQSKIEAITQSSFEEVLFLDADSFPRRPDLSLSRAALHQARHGLLARHVEVVGRRQPARGLRGRQAGSRRHVRRHAA